MVGILAIGCSLLLLLPGLALAGVTEEWAVRYNGPGNDLDSASALAVDASGNVYVTGYSTGIGYDYATIKYDTNGNQLWVARYNGSGNGHDIAVALVIDTAGNVYVTGYSPGSGTSSDYATIKYDTNGSQLWISRYNGPGNGNDYANALEIDATGNVYVTGVSPGSGTSNDYATIKYDTNGNQLWISRYNGPGNGNDNANTLEVDAAGNVYVAGYSLGTSDDFATIKYDTNGNQLWVSRYDGLGHFRDGASSLAVDDSGNVYVTGFTDYDFSSNLSNYATIKYDQSGNQLWVAIYNGPGNDTDSASDIAVDGAGNVYVTGYSYGATTSTDYATIKYDANGNQLWVARYDGPSSYLDFASDLAVDTAGNVYVTGGVYGPGPIDYATVKYDTNGSQLWAVHYNSPAGQGDDYAIALALDTKGNVYVTGYSYAPTTLYGYYDYATIKYSQTPSAELPRTGQTTCYDTAGAVIACAGTGQDGEIQAGVPWPDPRFADNGNGTVTDNLTGLMWTKNGNLPGNSMTWQQALDYVNGMNAGTYPNFGYTDWRLPNVNELKSMTNAGQPNSATWLNTQGFSNVQSYYYWSSTTYAYYTSGARVVGMWDGRMGYSTKSYGTDYYVWPVRSGQVGSFGSSVIQLPKTGQTTCYDMSGTVIPCAGTGQDGEIQAGVPWPNPRFTDNSNGTVTDNLTGLMWTKDGNASGTITCSPATTWQGALDYVTCLNTNSYLGYTDWRLPNANELQSMANAGQPNSATWLNTQGFSNVQSWYYWSSTSVADSTNGAWIVNMWYGGMYNNVKSSNIYYVWVVRSGQVGQTGEMEALINGAVGNQQSHTMAWNPVATEYLVLWQDFRNGASNPDIYGARLDAQGNVVAGDIPVVTQAAKQAGPWVAHGSSGGDYLAVWIDQRNMSISGTDVYGVWISDGGTVGSEFVITDAPANQRAASVVYNPSADNFLVTWIDDSAGATDLNIWGVVVSPSGGVISGPFAMVTSSGSQRGPYVRYDYGNSQYFMVWFDDRNGNYDVYGSRMTSGGVLSDGSGVVITNATGDQKNPRITDRDPLSGTGNYVLSWIDFRNGQADIYGALADEFGTRIGSDIQIAGGSYDQRAASIDVDYIRTGQAVVSWIDNRNGADYDIYRAQVDQSGLVSGEALVAGAATGAANNQQGPLVTYSEDMGVDNGFLMLWRDNRSGVDYDLYGIKVWP